MSIHSRPPRPRVLVLATSLLLANLGAGCTAVNAGADVAPHREPSPAAPRLDGWPTSMVVLGHSGVNGEGTPGDPLDNSWASGANPDVYSVYARILEREPAIEGHVTNLAVSGATVADVQSQVDGALELSPAPDLVVVQVVDNDMACPATQADADSFESDLADLLDRISRALPASRIFIPTFYADPASYITSLTAEQRRQVGSEGPCAIIATDGSTNRVELRRLKSIVSMYDAAIIDACKATDRCWDDGGAFERARLHRGEIGDDLSHLSISGNAHAAAVAWRAMRTVGVLPSN